MVVVEFYCFFVVVDVGCDEFGGVVLFVVVLYFWDLVVVVEDCDLLVVD